MVTYEIIDELEKYNVVDVDDACIPTLEAPGGKAEHAKKAFQPVAYETYANNSL